MVPRPPARIDARPAAIVAIPDVSSRERVSSFLTGLRWRVTEARGGAEALMHLEQHACEALLLDSWLPDLEMGEFVAECRERHPEVDLVMLDNVDDRAGRRSPRRQELLMALRHALDEPPAPPDRKVEAAGVSRAFEDGESRGTENVHNAVTDALVLPEHLPFHAETPSIFQTERVALADRIEEKLRAAAPVPTVTEQIPAMPAASAPVNSARRVEPLPELVGDSAAMQELCRMIRLVAPRRTTVLIEGPTGTGKELVARAVHRLSPRAHKPLMVLNCAAIPEALLEAELFGHTRGAFTGAVNARTGRIEAANGGTLFLDEIGEMPLMLQSKLLRFVESGELQRVGDNETVRVDVRVIAATHQPLAERAAQGTFRADLYYRLAVFPVQTPSLAARREDVLRLAQHFLRRHGSDGPVKTFAPEASIALQQYGWPGNVRELEHVIERAYILAEDRPAIRAEDLGLSR